jgi:chromosomal replication initiator protein
MTAAQFDTWLRGTSLIADDDGTSVLRVRSTFAKEMLESRYRERIQAAIGEVTGHQRTLRIAVAPTALDGDVPARLATPSTRAQVATRLQARAPRRESMEDGYVRPSLFALPLEPAAAMPARASQSTRPTPDRPSVTDGRNQGRDQDQERGTAPAPRRASRPRPALSRRRIALREASPAAMKHERVHTAIERARVDDDDGDGAIRASSGRHVTHPPSAIIRHTTSEAAATGGGMMRSGGHDEARSPRAPHGEATELAPSSQTERHPHLPDAAANGAVSGAAAIAPPRLNARYTFATFIVGSGNQLAHAASLAVADAPGQAYNPLFLYGGVGLGKTHLLHAIGHTAIERGLVVLYVSSETFTNEIINAIRFRTTEEFRAKYRSVDVLLVDDIQFIAGKDSTEEEFFHTFNSLYEMSKQIVICSDRPPKAIVSLEERLRSRFEWGLIADIQPPDLETRVAILRAKADLLQRQVPDEVLTYLAGAVQSNIRELEGSLNRLLAIVQLQGKPLTIETAKSAISNLATDGKQKRVGTDEVLAAVAEYYRISAADLQGKQRDKHIVVPRQVAMYLMRQETEASLLEIGQALGGRDHSTVLHGCEKISREVNENTALRKEVLAIRQQLFG